MFTCLIVPLWKPVHPVPGFKLEFRAWQASVCKIQEPREQRMSGRRFPVTRISVQPDMQCLHEGFPVFGTRGLIEGVVACQQQVQDLLGRRESPVGGQKDVDVGGLEFAIVIG